MRAPWQYSQLPTLPSDTCVIDRVKMWLWVTFDGTLCLHLLSGSSSLLWLTWPDQDVSAGTLMVLALLHLLVVWWNRWNWCRAAPPGDGHRVEARSVTGEHSALQVHRAAG